MPSPTCVALAAIAALTLSALPVAVSASAESLPPAADVGDREGGRGESTHTVTLITGDKVTIATAADGTVVRSFQAAGGATAGFHRAVVDGSTYVYPDAVLPYISAGKLDARLFNVTRLIADGFDDSSSSRLPLIVSYTATAARSRTQSKIAGSKFVRRLESVQGAALAQNRGHAPEFWDALTGGSVTTGRSAKPAYAAGIDKVWLDGKVTADLAESTTQIGAERVWAEGQTGEGVKVAVLDTGVDTEHPDLLGRIDTSTSFVPGEDVTDRHGHGTHVASTIAGTGSASEGKERGVAYDARLEIGKVLDSDGAGQESWIIAGMEWAARDQRAKIISMSLGGDGDATDPMSTAVDQLSQETGALFVVASGNSGPASIGSPGAADRALTVGAVDSEDRLADFSSTGPRRSDAGLKPELTAPGVDILAARSQYSRGSSGYYTKMSGTSMATPHVAGTAALLLGAHPDWTGAQLKDALVSSTKPTPSYTPYQGGSGRLDAAAALHASVFATSSAYSGFHSWPPKTGETDVQRVTYSNVGDTTAVLDLAADSPAPTGTFELSDQRISIPAHGNVTVSLTAHLDRLPADKQISGMITGTDAGGKIRARTLIGAYREGPRHTLTVSAKSRSGDPLAGRVFLTAENLWTTLDLDEAGTGTISLPEGAYSGWAIADVEGANGPHSLGMALLSFNDIQLDQDRTITLDGRKARQILARPPKDTTATAPRLDVHRSFSNSLAETSMLPGPSYDSIWALPTSKKVSNGRFEFGARFRLEQPALTVGTGSKTYDDLLVKRAVKPLREGTRSLKAVFAGQGTREEVSRRKVLGRAVVVKAADTDTIRAQAEAAAAAGAELLLIVHEGVGRLQPWDESPWGPESPAPLTVATLNADQGSDLLARLRRGAVTLNVASHPTTKYLFDVVHHWAGGVPADPSWKVGPRDVARVDVSFRNHQPGKALQFRADIWQGWAVGNMLTAPAQGERTDWVTSEAAWLDDAAIVGETAQHSLDVLRYPAGTAHQVNWFGPIQRPRMGPLGYQPSRYLDGVVIPAPGWGDSGAGHVGDSHANFDVKNWMALYQGDRQLDWGNAEILRVSELEAQRLPYRLVLDNERGTWANPYSTKTLTEWSFTSAASTIESAEPLPLIQLDYGVDTDTQGRTNRRAGLTVAASHLRGTTSRIAAISVEVSYDDGLTWQRPEQDRHGGSTRTRLHAPSSVRFVSLRVTAADSADNKVTQTITRAFGLR
ncbi:S8 family serine peptidase [Streptomyces sp. NPDC048643]|uniref:S8 family peptidase n=1 Tax=Streptomyces sp. NPDC048643 TaxID=3155637 RepID=UPI003426796E